MWLALLIAAAVAGCADGGAPDDPATTPSGAAPVEPTAMDPLHPMPPSGPGPDPDAPCPAFDGRSPSRNAPVVAAMADGRAFADALLAALQDARTGAWSEDGHAATGRNGTVKAALDGAALARLAYEVPGPVLPADPARMEAALRKALADAEVAGPFEATHWNGSQPGRAEAGVELYLIVAGQRLVPKDNQHHGPVHATVSQQGDRWSASVAVMALHAVTDQDYALPADEAYRLAAELVRCEHGGSGDWTRPPSEAVPGGHPADGQVGILRTVADGSAAFLVTLRLRADGCVPNLAEVVLDATTGARLGSVRYLQVPWC